MEPSTDRIVTTHCGSLARPKAVLELMAARHSGEAYDVEAYEEAVRTAVADCVRRQVEIGLDVVADGEQGRLGHASYVGERLSGFEPVPGGGNRLADFAAEASRFPDYYERYFGRSMQGGAVVRPAPLRCTGPVAYRGEEALERDLSNLRAALDAVGGRAAFVAAVAPSGVGSNAYYASEADYLFAVADALHAEYQAIVDAGFLLQVDDAVLHQWVSAARAKGLEQKEIDRFAGLRIEALNAALEGIPADRVRFHICWGSWNGPHTSDAPLADLIDLVLRVNADAYLIESANPRHAHEWRLWEDRTLPDGKILVPGVVNHQTNVVEHPELVAWRLEQLARLVGRENVMAGTDCGFCQGWHEVRVHPSIQWAKLTALAEGARLASERLWR